MLGRCPDTMPASELGDHSYIAYLEVDSIDGYHERAVAAGAVIGKPPTDEPWHRREMSLHAPEGHRFMLGQRI